MKKIIPIFVPHRGCPHDCIFCNQTKITGVQTEVTKDSAREIIEEYLETIDKNADIEIAFFGGSFTAIDVKVQEELLGVAKEYVDKGIVKDIRLSTRPDCINEEILTLLKKYSVTIIELGVQSLDEDVLRESIRGHKGDIVYKSAKLIKEFGIKLGLQMMIGLPTDNFKKCMYTAKEFVKIEPDCVRIYPTLVVKDTGLENLLSVNEYSPFTLDESINIVKRLLVLFYRNNINVIRVGLQSSEDIQVGKAILSGPYHPAFRELVESEIIKDFLDIFIKEQNIEKDVIINTNNKNISKIIGNKKSNFNYFKTTYNINLKTVPTDIDKNSLDINFENKNIVISIDDIYNKLYEVYQIDILEDINCI